MGSDNEGAARRVEQGTPAEDRKETENHEVTVRPIPEHRGKPHLNVMTLGEIGHGKTVLTAAIDKLMADRYGGGYATVEELRSAPEEKERGIAITIAHVEYQSANRHYGHMDLASHSDFVKNIITGAYQADGAVLVVSLSHNVTWQTREQILLARQVGIPYIVVYLNDIDKVDDENRVEVVKREVRDLLSSHEFPGDATPDCSGVGDKSAGRGR